ncbi:MAG: hypothetical protein KDB27_27365 [Planctomycetales bacterium]|nr:hypothetical protein [Planctomycetales bacterium]
MHNINELIADWRTRMANNDTFRVMDIDELEEHLRESVDELVQTGLALDEAFVVAERRLGSPNELGTEYAKTNGSYVWHHRVFWMTAGHLVATVAGVLITVVAQLAQTGGIAIGMNITAAAVVGPAVTVLCWSGAFWILWSTACGHRTSLRRIVSGSQRLASVTFVVFTLLAVAFAKVISLGSTAFLANNYGRDTYGRVAIVQTYFSLAWLPLFIVACATVMILVRRNMNSVQLN